MNKFKKALKQAKKIKVAGNKNKAVRKWCKLVREALR